MIKLILLTFGSLNVGISNFIWGLNLLIIPLGPIMMSCKFHRDLIKFFKYKNMVDLLKIFLIALEKVAGWYCLGSIIEISMHILIFGCQIIWVINQDV